jgi:hypothetical protein
MYSADQMAKIATQVFQLPHYYGVALAESCEYRWELLVDGRVAV